MLLSLRWLQNYVDISDIDPIELAEKITLAGLEVESIYHLSDASLCVVGKVLKKEKHPEADKLSVCQVDLGHEVTQIVCGAQNVAEGQKVVVSKIGAVLPGGLKIKATKLRGYESNGMICSLKELGIENKLVPQEFQNGIYVLDDDAEVGQDALDYLGLDDTILEIKTLNRSDCLSMFGLAYEVATILDKQVQKPHGEVIPFSIDNDFKVSIDSKDCSLYYAKKVKGVKVQTSPQWLQTVLIACGIRPINNVVDVTNFVMMELGQPLHAFDYQKLNSKNILVRNAKDNETLVTLDSITRELLPTDLVITDGKKPIALAGVMGGQNTEIDNTTTDVLLESAVFNPIAIRKTSSRLGLRSESSIRFEKKIDQNRTLYALNRAAALLVEIAGGTIDEKLAFNSQKNQESLLIKITLEKINKVLGIILTEKNVSEVFRRLKFDFVVLDGTFVVNVPSRRQDISIEEDLIEEIIRIHGYKHLNLTLPKTDTIGELTSSQSKTRRIKRLLQSCGLNETITYSLTNPKYLNRFNYKKNTEFKPVELSMPISEERKVMRYGLIHSLLEVIKYNNARNISDVAIYEIGKQYYMTDQGPTEHLLLTAAITGAVQETKWQKKLEMVDFFYLKGILEVIFDKLDIKDQISFIQTDEMLGEDFHNMRTAYVLLNQKIIGVIGQVHPNTQKEYDINETYVLEIQIDEIINEKTSDKRFETISKYPTMSRDMAIVVDEKITAMELTEAIKSKGKKILKSVEVFDVYQGEHVEKNKKSVAITLMFENSERTLTDDEVNKVFENVISHLEEQYNASLRK